MSYHFIFVIIVFILESNDDKDMGKKGTLTLLVIIGKLVQPVWKTVWSFLRKVKNRITVWSNNLTSGYLAKEIKSRSQRDNYTPMFIAALFIISNK